MPGAQDPPQAPGAKCGRDRAQDPPQAPPAQRPFTCPQCGRGFGRKAHLARHLLVHSGTRPHACARCGRRFSSKTNLGRHQAVHTGLRPHRCARCGRGFTRKNSPGAPRAHPRRRHRGGRGRGHRQRWGGRGHRCHWCHWVPAELAGAPHALPLKAGGCQGLRRMPAGWRGAGRRRRSRRVPEPEPSEEEEDEEDEEEEEEEADEGSGVQVTPAMLKATTGEFSLESILLLRLRGGRGIAHLGCLADCSNLEWLDLVEPMRGCRSLRRLNLAGNRLRSLRPAALPAGPAAPGEACACGTRAATWANPLCAAAPAYRAALAAMLPGLKAIDGKRVAGRRQRALPDVARAGRRARTPGKEQARAHSREPPRNWVRAGFWEARPARSGAVLEEGHAAAGPGLRECRELGRRADDSIARARRALGRRRPGDLGF
ncbi:hypothetical protein DUI87_33183 [Hirundo rustica rustica]|uniref:C2H2-type domain-containing protein n=1 Tax=Hirundo rustica rustica TaxID=333673 RepID=A0A3M0IPS6_HIRRU|nr:hypothetical protein DUI87_33183 [Hirundo rustica rustica]